MPGQGLVKEKPTQSHSLKPKSSSLAAEPRTIGTIRQELATTLGPQRFAKYLTVLQDWFGNKTLRCDWSISAPFLIGRALQLHNELMTGLLLESCRPDFESRRVAGPVPVPPYLAPAIYHQQQPLIWQESVSAPTSTSAIRIKQEPTSTSPEFGTEIRVSATTTSTTGSNNVITLHSSAPDESDPGTNRSFQIQYKILSPEEQLPQPLSQGQYVPEDTNNPQYQQIQGDVQNWNGNAGAGAVTSAAPTTGAGPVPPVVDEIPAEEDPQLPEPDSLITIKPPVFTDDDEIPEFIPKAGKDTRFPNYFIKDLIRQDTSSAAANGIIPNVTHLVNAEYWLKKVPVAYKYFKIRPADPVLGPQPFLTSGASIEGKFHYRAWEHGVKSVSRNAISFALKATKDHFKRILVEIIKNRKAYEITSDGRIVNLGGPRMNPYLLSKTLKRNTEIISKRFPDPVIFPPFPPCDDEEERYHALKYACSLPPSSTSHEETKISYVDLIQLLQSDTGKDLIPNSRIRLKLLENCFLNSKGYHGSLKRSKSREDSDSDSDSESESGQLLEYCSY